MTPRMTFAAWLMMVAAAGAAEAAGRFELQAAVTTDAGPARFRIAHAALARPADGRFAMKAGIALAAACGAADGERIFADGFEGP